MIKLITSIIVAIILITVLTSQSVLAESDYDDKLSFAGSLEETLGHFWAIEQNLDDDNAKLALVHASHPIAELYASMKPDLKAANPEFDAKVQKILMDLGTKTGSTVTQQDAQNAIDEAKAIIQEARILIVGDLSQDTTFKAKLMQGLLKTSIGEYAEGVKNGQIEMMAEFQDGSAFVWRSQQIFDEIKLDIPEDDAKEIAKSYDELLNAYAVNAEPEQIEIMANEIIDDLYKVTGEKSENIDLLVYVKNIRDLLTDVKAKYAEGDKDTALSLATKAYLDNFEFLEAPLVKSGQEDMMKELEIMMRIDLRDKISNNAPTSEVNQQVDAIILKMDTVAKIVPEFGSVAAMILIVGIISVVLISKSKNLTILPRI